MSIVNGFLTNEDGEVVKIAAIISISPITGEGGRGRYEVIMQGSHHLSIKESHVTRAELLAAWQAV